MKPVFKWKQQLFTINFNVEWQLVLRSSFCISANFVDQDHWMWRSERLPHSAVGNKLQSGDEPAPSQRDRSVGQLLRHDEPYVHAANDTSLHFAWRDRRTARSQIQIHKNRRGKGRSLYFATCVATWLLTLEMLKVKAKVLLNRPRKALQQLHSFLTSAREGGEWTASRSGHFITQITMYMTPGWAPDPVLIFCRIEKCLTPDLSTIPGFVQSVVWPLHFIQGKDSLTAPIKLSI